MKRPSLVCCAFAISAGPALSQEVMKREPPFGALRTGTIVLVDDGTCPRGQIKEVRGGVLGASGGRGGGGQPIKRERRCIPR